MTPDERRELAAHLRSWAGDLLVTASTLPYAAAWEQRAAWLNNAADALGEMAQEIASLREKAWKYDELCK